MKKKLKQKSLIVLSAHTNNECELWQPVLTYVLLVVLALCSHRLLGGAVTVLRAAAQAVRHTIHLLQRFEPI